VALRLPRSRVRAWLEALEKAAATADRLAARLGGVTVLLYGSYARGDFNVWSDIDLVVVSEAFMGLRFLDRYDIVSDDLEAGIEPVLLTVEEFLEALRKPSWVQALSKGAVVLRDDHGIKPVIEAALGIRLKDYRRFKREVVELLAEAVDLED